MGKIILLEPHRHSGRYIPAPIQNSTGGNAQIMFFTGVRYERTPHDPQGNHPEPDNKGTNSSQSPRSRKKRA